MGVLVLMESKGDREQLLAASDDLLRRAGRAEGLLLRVIAPTDDGLLLIHLWESDEARERWHANPQHQDALRDSGMTVLAHERHVRVLQAHHVDIGLADGR
jgi:heme-degrading monooxygenase HmoA